MRRLKGVGLEAGLQQLEAAKAIEAGMDTVWSYGNDRMNLSNSTLPALSYNRCITTSVSRLVGSPG